MEMKGNTQDREPAQKEGEGRSPWTHSKPTEETTLELSLPIQKTKDKEVGWGRKRKQRKWRRKQLPSQLSQGSLLTPNGATGETEVGSRSRGDSYTQLWLHTQIPLASWPEIGPSFTAAEGRRRLPFAVLSSWQKQSTIHEPGQSPFPPTRQTIPWAWERHLARILVEGAGSTAFLVPGEITRLTTTNCFDAKNCQRKRNGQTLNGCSFAPAVAVTAAVVGTTEFRRATIK